MLQDEILVLLSGAGEEYLSGESMSRTMGVSRAAVWKAVEGLRKAGYQIDSASNRGYRLAASPDTLRAGELSGRLEGRLLGRELVVLSSVDSTSSEIKRRAAGGAPEGLAVLANEQTGGRGRRGNAFQSLKGKGLYCSVLLRPQVPLARVGALTAWAAVAVCRTLESCCGLEAGIKWTNDIVVRGRKLCGILTELEVEAESGAPGSVALGVGINVGQTREDFGPELDGVATSLRQELGVEVRRAELATELLLALDRMYAAFPGAEGEYLHEYRRRCVTTGREVLLLRGGESLRAFALKVEEDFSLLCQGEDGETFRVTAGEVSVRGLMGYG